MYDGIDQTKICAVDLADYKIQRQLLEV